MIFDKVDVAGKQAGFTLIEMIVVIAVMAMVAGLVMVKQPWRSASLNLDMTVRSLTNGLRLARSRAIAQDRDVVVNVSAHGFNVDGANALSLPPEQILTSAHVIFTPDGGSTGGSILLTSGTNRILVDVSWLTGRIRSRKVAND